jgi:16S rRNA processing protein RimM
MSAPPDELLLIGQIGAPFGLHGQLKLRAITHHTDHIQEHVSQLYIGPDYTLYRVRDIFEHKPGLLVLALDGIHTREEAVELRSQEVYIHEEDAAPLEEGEYFIHQLYNLRVETETGEELGHVREVLETGANDVLVVARPGQKDLLLPIIRDVVQVLDIAGGRVVVRLLEGLD